MKRIVGLTVLLILTGCSAQLDNDVEEEVAVNSEALIDANSHSLVVQTGNTSCAGVLLTNAWVLTSSACGVSMSSNTQLIKYKYTPRTPVEVINSGNFTLIRANDPYSMWGDLNTYRQPLYVQSVDSLRNRTLRCYKGEDKFIGQVTVTGVSGPDSKIWFTKTDRTALNVTAGEAGWCQLDSFGGAQYVGMITEVSWSSGAAKVLTDRRWAIQSMYAKQRIACHGLECLTTPNPLPNNVEETIDWEPCGGKTGKLMGNYSWSATFDLETNWDYILLSKDAWSSKLTGWAPMSGSPSIPSGGNSVTKVRLHTDSSEASVGLKSMTATCMNALIRGTGYVDEYSTVLAQDQVGDGRCIVSGAQNVTPGCGIVVPPSTKVLFRCVASNFPTRKVSSITYSQPDGTSSSYNCGGIADCRQEVVVPAGLSAQCNFTQ